MGVQNKVDSDDRLFDIIEALVSREGAGVTELAEVLEMPKSTVHVHLSTLNERGYVVKDDGTYHASMRFLDLGGSVRRYRTVADTVSPKLREIAEETGENVWYLVEEGGRAVFASNARGRYAVSMNVRVGQHVVLPYLGAGVAILAHLPRERRRSISEEYGDQATRGTAESATLEERVARVRDRGVAVSEGRFVGGVTDVGAPIVDNSGTVYGAIGVFGPADRFDEDQVGELADHLRCMTSGFGVNLSTADAGPPVGEEPS